ncbi:GNAT family N-acetyltransferase [Microbacterium indicum]|uniref:GNAT family N-acetyltransferase n=1 Tax=Microbacterium indicum TaxID=358100 RepID=UPI0003FFB54B|nr:GNAT family N-acetyltransferase [Microbacterium indicum]
MTLEIRIDDLTSPATRELVASHVAEMHSGAESAEFVYAYDVDALTREGVTLFSAWEDGALAGVGGLAGLGGDGELKSFRTAAAFLGRGVGRAILRRAIAEARSRGYANLWLETGTSDAFAAARHLYASEGFAETGPFGRYPASPESYFMTRAL